MTRAERVDAAARALIERIRFIHGTDAYMRVWQIAQLHDGAYSGPQYERELLALDAALGPPPDAPAPDAPEAGARWPHCATCERPATCLGVYEDPADDPRFGCDVCCGHGNEDGTCFRMPGAPAASAAPPDPERAYYDHLDVCAHCRAHPFDLCATGLPLFKRAGEAVGAGSSKP